MSIARVFSNPPKWRSDKLRYNLRIAKETSLRIQGILYGGVWNIPEDVYVGSSMKLLL